MLVFERDEDRVPRHLASTQSAISRASRRRARSDIDRVAAIGAPQVELAKRDR